MNLQGYIKNRDNSLGIPTREDDADAYVEAESDAYDDPSSLTREEDDSEDVMEHDLVDEDTEDSDFGPDQDQGQEESDDNVISETISDDVEVTVLKTTQSVLVVLNLTDVRMMKQRNLSAVSFGSDVNMYNPLRKGDVGKPAGVFRDLLPKVVEQVASLNMSNTLFLGDESLLVRSLGVLGAKNEQFVVDTICDSLGITTLETKVAAGAEGSDLLLSDFVAVDSWLVPSKGTLQEVEIVTSIALQVPELYDRDDKAMFLERIVRVVSTQIETKNIPYNVAFNMSSSMLSNSSVRLMLHDLFDSDRYKYSLISQSDWLEKQAGFPFMPVSLEDVALMFPFGGDILLWITPI